MFLTWGDMTKIKVENLENGDQEFTSGDGTVVLVPGGVDLLVGGTPCQGFSVAGKQGGLDDDRSVLCLTFVRLLEEMRPRWFVWENVPGVFSTNGGEDFKAFLRAIDEVGYSCAFRVLDAQYCRVDGYPRAIPQRRRRVFVIGHSSGDWRYPAEVLFEPHSLSGNTPPRRVKGQGVTADAQRCLGTASRTFSSSCHGGCASAAAGTLKSSSGDIGGGSENLATFWNGEDVSTTLTEASADDHMPDKGKLPCVVESVVQKNDIICLNDQGGSVMNVEQDGNAGTLRANTHGNEQIVCVHGAETPIFNTEAYANLVTANHNGLENVISCNSKQNGAREEPVAVAIDQQGGKGNASFAENICPTILSDSHGTPHAVAIVENIIGRQVQNGGNGTVQEELAHTQNASGVVGAANHATVRRLLPIECERLMGFPDNWTRIPWKGKPAEDCPDSPRYKACGNSMCVNVMRWIGMRIEMLERRLK